MKVQTILVSAATAVTLGSATQSCMAVATSSLGIAVIKQVLLGGITKGVHIFGNKNAFLQNDLIEKAIPENLRSTYALLDKIAPNLTAQGKDYIAQAAAYTVNTAEPILKNAVNNLTAEDVAQIANGGSGAATRLLKAKTAEQLITAIQPKVDEKLNEFGIVKSINMALQGNNVLGNLLGNQTNTPLQNHSLSRLASEQIVNGLFNIIEDHEKQNAAQLPAILQNH
ncbi:DUF4197 family protein [Bergeyella sp. RCAD1439]|uniref:DUF4197 family protein n=1 Tax=Bergeyella anatis TaxID=3113737 RepID=UPI002E187EAA|nr:DUF4197 family protein [Bergeyella sp. RCAD1439]